MTNGEVIVKKSKAIQIGTIAAGIPISIGGVIAVIVLLTTFPDIPFFVPLFTSITIFFGLGTIAYGIYWARLPDDFIVLNGSILYFAVGKKEIPVSTIKKINRGLRNGRTSPRNILIHTDDKKVIVVNGVQKYDHVEKLLCQRIKEITGHDVSG